MVYFVRLMALTSSRLPLEGRRILMKVKPVPRQPEHQRIPGEVALEVQSRVCQRGQHLLEKEQ